MIKEPMDERTTDVLTMDERTKRRKDETSLVPHPSSLVFTSIVLASLVLASLVLASLVYAAAPPKYWKDLLKIKPNTEWVEAYGWGDESFLANHAWRMEQLVEAHGLVIQEMKKEMDLLRVRVDALEGRDPNCLELDPVTKKN